MTQYTDRGISFPEGTDEVAVHSDIRDTAVLTDQAITESENETKAYADERLPVFNEDGSWRVRDTQGAEALRVGTDGVTHAHDLVSRRAVIAGAESRRNADGAFRLVDLQGRVALEVGPDGRTFIGDLIGGGGVVAGPRRVHLDVWMGASNAEGRGRPWNERLDPPNRRIQMWHWPTASIREATVPLSSRQQQVGTSPATPVAQLTVGEDPEAVVVILNGGVGGTPLLGENSGGVWAVDYAGSNPHLFDTTMAAVSQAVTAIGQQYALVPQVRFFFAGGPGGATSGAAAAFGAAIDALIDACRAHVGQAGATFVMLNRVPENNTEVVWDNGIVPQIQAPRRRTHAAWADGPPNGGGSASVGDLNHYHRWGIEGAGALAFEAWRRALVNYNSTVPHPPEQVTGRLYGGTLHISWSMPYCRVTAFVVQYSTDGGSSWTTVTDRPVELYPQAVVPVAGPGPVLVRVATTGATATSAFSTPVTAIGA